MKRIMIIITLIIIVLLSTVGCKKSNNIQESEALNKTDNVVNNENEEEEEYVYDYSNKEGKLVNNEAIISEIQDFIEKFYYNYLFRPESELGEITEKDMQLFAISYIYQFEYEDLRFDLDKFVLYIPEENVSEVIKTFFDYDFTNHKYPENAAIDYENGYYLMKAQDDKFGAKPIIKEALKYSDSNYKIVFSSSSVDSKEDFEVIIREVKNRWVMLNFKKMVLN